MSYPAHLHPPRGAEPRARPRALFALGGGVLATLGSILPWWRLGFGRAVAGVLAPEAIGLRGRFGWLLVGASLAAVAVGVAWLRGAPVRNTTLARAAAAAGATIVAVALVGLFAPGFSLGLEALDGFEGRHGLDLSAQVGQYVALIAGIAVTVAGLAHRSD